MGLLGNNKRFNDVGLMRDLNTFESVNENRQNSRQSSNSPNINFNLLDKFMNKGGSSGGGLMGNTPDYAGDFSGLSGSGSSSGGGMSGLGMAGIIAAAIAAQHGLSNQTDTVFEGQKTDDAFGGSFGTEPWLGWVNDKMDWEPTIGEKWDAAVKNDDWDKAFMRTPGMTSYWANPVEYWGYNAAQNELGDVGGFLASPMNWIWDKIGN